MRLAPSLGWLTLVACLGRAPSDLLGFSDAGRATPQRPGAATGATVPWSSAFCAVPDDADGGDAGTAADASALALSGECNFVLTGPAICHFRADDAYVVAKRKLREGRLLTLYINVEKYRGPGAYGEAQLHAWIGEGKILYRWSQTEGPAFLRSAAELQGRWAAAGAAATDPVIALELPQAVLSAEPGTPTQGEIRLKGQLHCAPTASGMAFTPLAP